MSFQLMLLVAAGTLGQAPAQPLPTLQEIDRGLEELGKAVRSYSVELSAYTKSSFPAEFESQSKTETKIIGSEHIDWLQCKMDTAGRVYIYGTKEDLNLKEGENTKETIEQAFDGNVARRIASAKKIFNGRIMKERVYAFSSGIGVDPLQLVNVSQDWVPLRDFLHKYQEKATVIGTDKVSGREVVVIQVKGIIIDGKQELASFYYLDPVQNFAIVKAASAFRPLSSSKWTEYSRLVVLEAEEDASGVMLPTRALQEWFDMIGTKSAELRNIRHSEIKLYNWHLNPELEPSLFSLKFPPGTLVVDEINGRTFQAAAINDQLVADQAANSRQFREAVGRRPWMMTLSVSAGLLLLALAAWTWWRRRRTASLPPQAQS